MSTIINGKMTFGISLVALGAALLVGGVNFGLQAATSQHNTKAIEYERAERIKSESDLRQQWLAEVRGLNARIDDVLRHHAGE